MKTSTRHLPPWFVRWYMGRIAGRYCPCEWPIKIERLIRWCARIDDEQARLEFIRFASFHTSTNTTSANASNVTVRWTRSK